MGEVYDIKRKPPVKESQHRAICQRCEFVQGVRGRAEEPMYWQCGAVGRYCSSQNYEGECRLFAERKPRIGWWKRLFGGK